MKTHNINTELKGKTIKYLEFAWKAESKNQEKEQNLIEQLPEFLRKEILFESNKKSLFQFKILKHNFHEEILNKLSSSMKTIKFSPKEIIYSVNFEFFIIKLKNLTKKGDFDIDDPSLYLIVNGNVEIYFNERIIKTLDVIIYKQQLMKSFFA